MPLNPWITNSFIDSCAFDPKYTPEDEAAKEIFRLYTDEQLSIMIAHSIQKEIEHPNTPTWVKSEAVGLIYTLNISLTQNEGDLLRRIQKILTGEGKPENVEQDARHIFEAQKYGSYFVTTDQRLLRRAGEIKALCGVEILLPTRFLALARQYRDQTEDET